MENQIEKILLWEGQPEEYSAGDEIPFLTPYLVHGSKGCVIVCPGGAYGFRAPHEGIDIAKEFNKEGISAFVLSYRVAPSSYPSQLYDVLRAIRVVRSLSKANCGAYYESNKIAIMGFSAGGHLSVMAAQHFDLGRNDGDETDSFSSRPDLAVLCYPVVSLLEYTHIGSRNNLIGKENAGSELARRLSGELAVRCDMPPVFVWHTADDTAVNVMNSINLCASLAEKKIPFEIHVFPHGRHGLGLAKEEKSGVGVWFSLLIKFLINNGW